MSKRSHEISLDMFKKGMSIEQIANKRSLRKSVIQNHLRKAIDNNNLKAIDLINSKKVEKISQIVDSLPESDLKVGLISKVEDKLSISVTDHEIKTVLSEYDLDPKCYIRRARIKGESPKISLEMYNDGMSIEQIAAKRNLKEETIKDHLRQTEK